MTPSQLAVEVQSANDEDVNEAIQRALTEAGVTLDELIEEAKVGRFSSEDARMAWWVVSPFVDAAA
jgi:hypothetical protein